MDALRRGAPAILQSLRQASNGLKQHPEVTSTMSNFMKDTLRHNAKIIGHRGWYHRHMRLKEVVYTLSPTEHYGFTLATRFKKFWPYMYFWWNVNGIHFFCQCVMPFAVLVMLNQHGNDLEIKQHMY